MAMVLELASHFGGLLKLTGPHGIIESGIYAHLKLRARHVRVKRPRLV